MALCRSCRSDDLDLVEKLPDGRRRVRCNACGEEWVRGEAAAPSGTRPSYDVARERFPTLADVDPARRERAETLKARFLSVRPEPDPDVTEYWARYQTVFSESALDECDPADLKDFANVSTGARLGNMSVFNRAWNDLGTEAAADRTPHTIRYLLYAPGTVPIEDRLTEVIEDDKGRFMTGFKEVLLTKVLCVAHPDRFVPILTYTSEHDGKKEIAQKVFGLRLPERSRTHATIGRLIVWSNDLLVELAGEGFATNHHRSRFLWESKDSPDLQP